PPPPKRLLSYVPEHVFKTPFRPEGLYTPRSSDSLDHWFETTWNIPGNVDIATVRLLSNRSYDIFINGRRLNSENQSLPALDRGEWVLSSQRAKDIIVKPELLDPDEVGFHSVGQAFESPRHSDPTINDFRPYENSLNRTRERPSAANRQGSPGEADSPQSAGQPAQFSDYRPGSRTPLSLVGDRNREEFNAYAINNLLRNGQNQIRIRMLSMESHSSPLWQGRFALDAIVQLHDGREINFRSGRGWTTWSKSSSGLKNSAEAVVTKPVTYNTLSKRPPLKFQGFRYSQRVKLLSFALCTIASFLILAALCLPILKAFFRDRNKSENESGPGDSEHRLRIRYCLLLILPITLIGSILLLQFSFAERAERLWLQSQSTWFWVTILSIGSLAFGWALHFHTIFEQKNGKSGILTGIQQLPTTRYWPLLITLALFLCFFLRANDLDFHPVDDDEYASIQASSAIAQKGIPQYSESVWYTRSPLYHYLSGAVIFVFGENLWSIRLLSVAFGVATGWLTYRLTNHLFKNSWLAYGALIVYSLHPFLIYTAHIGRFYQQQQFFYILTIYLFHLGFLDKGGTSAYRQWCIISLFLTIISQELSIIFCFQLLGAYLILCRNRSYGDEFKLALISITVVALTIIDLTVFKVRTLTRLEGISPNVESTLAPNFGSLMNYFSLFLGYSRLHLGLSLLFFLGLVAALFKANIHTIGLYFFVFSGIILTNLLVTGDSLRYLYWLIPLWIILGLYGLQSIPRLFHRIMEIQAHPCLYANFRRTVFFFISISYLAILLSWSPWRIWNSYDTKILGDASGAFQYIRANLRPGDKVAATEPHPHGMLIETGHSDYDIAFPLLFDFTYLRDGKLVDRNANAQVVYSLDQLQNLLQTHDRIWIAINREKFRSRGKNIRWEYPGSRVEKFLRHNFEIKFQSYLWSVFLWDARSGRYKTYRTQQNY
ncbi:MAG: glycosyltransferase family 39 protein, partial [Verrucomicrobiota bacterium]